MIKQMISFSDPQHFYLKKRASLLGIPIAELVRRAVDAYRTDRNIDRLIETIKLLHPWEDQRENAQLAIRLLCDDPRFFLLLFNKSDGTPFISNEINKWCLNHEKTNSKRLIEIKKMAVDDNLKMAFLESFIPVLTKEQISTISLIISHAMHCLSERDRFFEDPK